MVEVWTWPDSAVLPSIHPTTNRNLSANLRERDSTPYRFLSAACRQLVCLHHEEFVARLQPPRHRFRIIFPLEFKRRRFVAVGDDPVVGVDIKATHSSVGADLIQNFPESRVKLHNKPPPALIPLSLWSGQRYLNLFSLGQTDVGEVLRRSSEDLLVAAVDLARSLLSRSRGLSSFLPAIQSVSRWQIMTDFGSPSVSLIPA